MNRFNEKLEAFRAFVEEEEIKGLLRRHPDWQLEMPRARVIPRRKYTLVDVEHGCSWSGKYVVENDSGEIYGCKGYGVIHRGHHYGNLDTVAQFDWSEYYPTVRKGVPK